jgi:hypothetical protein
MTAFMAWWRRRSRKAKIGLVVGAVVAVIVVIGALAPSEDTGDNGGTNPSAAAPQPEPEPEPPPPPPAEEDTGRMSDGEYDLFSSQVADVDQEVGGSGATFRSAASSSRRKSWPPGANASTMPTTASGTACSLPTRPPRTWRAMLGRPACAI